jgi:hypothetical protein
VFAGRLVGWPSGSCLLVLAIWLLEAIPGDDSIVRKPPDVRHFQLTFDPLRNNCFRIVPIPA